MSSSNKQTVIDIKKNFKFILPILLGILTVGLVVGFFYLGRGLPANPDTIVIENVRFVDYDKTYSGAADKMLVIDGSHHSNRFGFLRSRQRFEGDKMYLSLEYTLKSRLNPYHHSLSSKFQHSSTATDLNSVRKIYLEGMNHQKPKLIFTRDSPNR